MNQTIDDGSVRQARTVRRIFKHLGLLFGFVIFPYVLGQCGLAIDMLLAVVLMPTVIIGVTLSALCLPLLCLYPTTANGGDEAYRQKLLNYGVIGLELCVPMFKHHYILPYGVVP